MQAASGGGSLVRTAGLEITVRPPLLCVCLPWERPLPRSTTLPQLSNCHQYELTTGPTLTFATHTASKGPHPARVATLALSTGRCIRILHGSHDGQGLEQFCQVDSDVDSNVQCSVPCAMHVRWCLLPRKASTAGTHRCRAGRNIRPRLFSETSIRRRQVDVRHAEVASEGLSCSLQVRALNDCP